MIATAYCDRGTTATGIQAGPGIIATDPSVIPLHSLVRINNKMYRAEDTGGAVIGKHIDIWMQSCQQAIAFGVKRVQAQL